MQSTQLCKNLSICFSSAIGELNAQNKTVVYHNKYLWKLVQCRPAVLTLHNLETFIAPQSAHGVHNAQSAHDVHSAHFVQTEEEWRWQLPQ